MPVDGLTRPDDLLLRMRSIVKRFPGVTALDGVDLEVRSGEVHCLLGQNGAGKSTLIKVLAGAHPYDSGEIEWRGRPYRPGGPTDAMRLGIATIYQELDLVDGLSVAENIVLGHERRNRFGWVRRRETATLAAELLERMGHPEIPVGREVGRLPAAGRQIVSIARALSHDVRLLIMDEPSAVLAHTETDNLFRVIRELTDRGTAVVYISHRLAEIREIGDRVTVLKDGRTVGAGLPAQTTPTRDLVRMMAGREVEYAIPPRTTPPPGDGGTTERPVSGAGDASGTPVPEASPGSAAGAPPASGAPPLLQVERLAVAGAFEEISFEVRAGEIVGLAGLVGAGRSEILEAVYGARRPDSGRVVLDGRPVPSRPSAAAAAGIGLAPEERKSQGLLLHASLGDNITVSTLARYSRFGRFDRRAARQAAEEQISRLDIRPGDPLRPVRTLSGGNQQKAVLARWLLHGCRLLLLDEPTRGVDVGARAELYGLIRGLADAGVGVLLVSSEVPEVLGLSDRVLVVREGRVVRTAPAAELDEETVLNLVMEGEASAT